MFSVLADKHYLQETNPDVTDGRNLVRVCQGIRDEVMALSLQRHGGRSRELALVATKLDEARLWAVAYGESIGSHAVIDKTELLGGSPSAT